jgi:outer membrane lipoprotein-sorting protein
MKEKDQNQMFRYAFFAFCIIVLVMTTTLMVGCGSNATSPTASVSNSSSINALDKLIDMVAGIKTVKYEYTASALGTAVITQKIWLKGDKIRVETTGRPGPDVVILADMEKKTGYEYLPDQNMAVKIDFSKVPSPMTRDVETIKKYNPEITGNEVIDGKDCTVIKYTKEKAEVKAWLWNDNGFPLKFEVETPQGLALFEIKNVEFGDIPDSIFEVPEGVLRSD